ncbi:MAG: YqgE/AlgH family protein [Planctomycetota bacterium]
MSVRVDPGTLLLSAPSLRDPNFMHTVVLMCQHDEDGAFGLVVNRTGETRVKALFPDHPLLSSLDVPVRQGGPVGRDTLQILHRVPPRTAPDDETALGGVELIDGLWIGGDLEEVARFTGVADDPDALVRFVVGYAGWGEGQLESEIRIGSWLPLPATPELVFSRDDPEAVWREAMSRLGGGGPSLAHLPPDPSWN